MKASEVINGIQEAKEKIEKYNLRNTDVEIKFECGNNHRINWFRISFYQKEYDSWYMHELEEIEIISSKCFGETGIVKADEEGVFYEIFITEVKNKEEE